jgi:hypothetical protein
MIAARIGFDYYFATGKADSPLDDTPSKRCAALVFEEIAHGRTSSRYFRSSAETFGMTP